MQVNENKRKRFLYGAVIVLTLGIVLGGYYFIAPLFSGQETSGKDHNGAAQNAADSSLSLTGQQRLAVSLFNEIADKDERDLEEIEALYIRIMLEAPDTTLAEEAYWLLSNMYLQAFSPPRNDDAIALLESYLLRYPESKVLDEKFALFSAPDGIGVVKNRLLRLYEDSREWEKGAFLLDQFIPDPSRPEPHQVDDLVRYGMFMEQTGRTEEAIAAYQSYLQFSEDPADFMVTHVQGKLASLESATPGMITQREADIVPLDGDYYIDYENGTIPISDLAIGARVVDPSWEWEFRLGFYYSDKDFRDNPTPAGEVKPITWIVVAKDHYDINEPHVTLLSEELIGGFAFDNSTDRDHQDAQYGYNHWGESGTGNATHGLRPWLNSTGIHSNEGFYLSLPDNFKSAILTTNVPNKEWRNGNTYITQDKVFIPSTTELGDTDHHNTYQIGEPYAYFQGADRVKRGAPLGEDIWIYLTRSPNSQVGGYVINCQYIFESNQAYFGNRGVRPALNLKADILVSEIGQ